MEGEGHRVRRMTRKDIGAAQALAQKVWSEQAFRDTGHRIDYPRRVKRMFEGYLRAEPRGSFVAIKDEEMVGASYSHRWGRIGWIGPIEVLPESQNKGVGTALSWASVDHLEQVGCDTIGVETLGESEAHVAFYRKLGFSVHSPSFFYEKRLPKELELSGETLLLPIQGYGSVLDKIKTMSNIICPGMDLSVEFWMSYIANLGRILVYQDPNDPEKVLGAALVYGRTMEGVDSHLLRLLILDPTYDEQTKVAAALLQDAEFLVKRMSGTRMFFSSSVTAASVSLLADMDYRVIGNNVRLTRGGSYVERGDMQIISWAG